MRIRNAMTLCILCFGTPAVFGQAACTSTATGDLHFHQLSSKIFNNTRTIRVLLPQGYNAPANSEKRYPVLYLLDGQNLFDACLSEVSRKEWQVDETMYRLAAEKAIPEMIVVGIDHAGPKRAHEYLPYEDYFAEMEEPAGKQFPDFLMDEVMPLVTRQYRTLTGQQNTGIGGSSYGGVASLYALMAKPGIFGHALIESPSLTIGMGQLVRDTSPLIAIPLKVFIGFGEKESDNPAYVQKMIALIRMVETNFRAAGYDDSNLRVIVDPEGKHDEPAWAKRFPDAMKFLFADWKSHQ
jgi:predicted alpha/beta superfamily hydrolase